MLGGETKESFLFILIYSISLVLLISFSSLISFWLSLELNILSFLLLCFKSDSLYHSIFSINYFLIQSLGSILLLVSSLESTYIGFEIWSIIFSISVSLNIGIFPFHFWIFHLGPTLAWLLFCLLLTFHKFPMFLLLSIQSTLVMLFIVSSGIFGSLILLYSDSVNFFLISSSLYSTLWLYIIMSGGVLMSLIFLIGYFSSLLLLNPQGLAYLPVSFFVLMSFFLGFPPSSMFFLKYYTTIEFLSGMSLFMFSLTWAITFLATCGYLNFLLVFLRSYFYSVSTFQNNSRFSWSASSFLSLSSAGFLVLF